MYVSRQKSRIEANVRYDIPSSHHALILVIRLFQTFQMQRLLEVEEIFNIVVLFCIIMLLYNLHKIDMVFRLS